MPLSQLTLFATLSHVRSDIYPRIKASLSVINRGDGTIYIGDARSGLVLDAIPFLAILRTCTGARTCDEVAGSEHLATLDHLHQLGLIEYLTRPVLSTATPQQHLFNARERLDSEGSIITHRPGCGDGGLSEIDRRSELTIEILGDTRIARNLLALLGASGFTSSTLHLSHHDQPLLQARDLNGLTVTAEHLGKSKALHHGDISRQTALHGVKSAAGKTSEPLLNERLVIATAGASAQEIQHWQSMGTRHIAISEVIAQAIEISPIIHPGKGPCLRCIALHRRDALPLDLSTLASAQHEYELPAASAALVAALLTTWVANYLHATSSREKTLPDYARYSQVISLLEPTHPIERRRWSFHPECGCVDVRRRVLPR